MLATSVRSAPRGALTSRNASAATNAWYSEKRSGNLGKTLCLAARNRRQPNRATSAPPAKFVASRCTSAKSLYFCAATRVNAKDVRSSGTDSAASNASTPARSASRTPTPDAADALVSTAVSTAARSADAVCFRSSSRFVSSATPARENAQRAEKRRRSPRRTRNARVNVRSFASRAGAGARAGAVAGRVQPGRDERRAGALRGSSVVFAGRGEGKGEARVVRGSRDRRRGEIGRRLGASRARPNDPEKHETGGGAPSRPPRRPPACSPAAARPRAGPPPRRRSHALRKPASPAARPRTPSRRSAPRRSRAGSLGRVFRHARARCRGPGTRRPRRRRETSRRRRSRGSVSSHFQEPRARLARWARRSLKPRARRCRGRDARRRSVFRGITRPTEKGAKTSRAVGRWNARNACPPERTERGARRWGLPLRRERRRSGACGLTRVFRCARGARFRKREPRNR